MLLAVRIRAPVGSEGIQNGSDLGSVRDMNGTAGSVPHFSAFFSFSLTETLTLLDQSSILPINPLKFHHKNIPNTLVSINPEFFEIKNINLVSLIFNLCALIRTLDF